MQILITITYYYPYVSGLTIHVQRLAEALAQKKHSITILTSQHQKTLHLKETSNNVPITRIPYLLKLSKGFIMPGYFFSAFNLVKENELIVINLPQAEGLIPALLAKLMGKRVICIYHCEVVLPKGFSNSIIQYLLNSANFISLVCAHKVVTYTKDFGSHSKYLRLFRGKLKFIYPPIPAPNINNKVKKELELKIPKKKSYYIGLAARIAAEKGVEYLLGAIPLLKNSLGDDFIILIAGPKDPVGEDKYWNKISPLLKAYENNLLFLGTLSQEKMGAYYSLLDVLVLPSVNSTEAFGMVQVEAMFWGIPVIASDLPGVRIPVLETGMGEIVRVKDSNDLVEKITKVLSNKKKYIKERKDILKIFNFDDTIGKYEKLFSSLNNISISK